MIFTQGAFNVVIQNSKVLMVKRRDLPLWDLPGGKVEHYETPQQAAIREMHEETGYQIKIICCYGQYHDIKRKDCQHLFLSEIISGSPQNQTTETTQLKWFPVNRLPINTVPFRKRQIRTAFNVPRYQTYEIRENFLISLLRKILGK